MAIPAEKLALYRETARQRQAKDRITDLALSLQSCYEAVQQDLQNFKQFLLDISPG
jgi:hypothetical protein